MSGAKPPSSPGVTAHLPPSPVASQFGPAVAAPQVPVAPQTRRPGQRTTCEHGLPTPASGWQVGGFPAQGALETQGSAPEGTLQEAPALNRLTQVPGVEPFAELQ